MFIRYRTQRFVSPFLLLERNFGLLDDRFRIAGETKIGHRRFEHPLVQIQYQSESSRKQSNTEGDRCPFCSRNIRSEAYGNSTNVPLPIHRQSHDVTRFPIDPLFSALLSLSDQFANECDRTPVDYLSLHTCVNAVASFGTRFDS